MMSNAEKDDKWKRLAENINKGFVVVDSAGNYSLNIKKLTENNEESRNKLKNILSHSETIEKRSFITKN